jgi:cell division protein FtsN
MNEVALFMDALRAAVPSQPDPMLGDTLVPRLASTARASTLEAETRAVRARSSRRHRSRLASVAKVGIAVALIPLVLAGLAVAGVTVPSPARSAFDSIGVNLPNQPDEHSQTSGTQGQGGNDVSDAAKTSDKSDKGNSAAAHRHALAQRAKAKGKAIGHTKGKAIGLNDLTPPAQSGATGPSTHSNAGGESASHPSHAAPRAHLRPFPPASSRGRSPNR